MGAKTKRNILDKTACVFVLKSAKREVAIVGYTCDLKRRLIQQNKPRKNPRPRSRKHNAGTWIPVMAVTGFKTQKDAMSFEWFVKKVVKQKEYNDYVKLYRGRCPATVIKRILAIRGLLCEQDKWWSSKRQRYCCHWFGKSFGDEMQFRKMQFNWGRTGRPVEHIDMELDGIEELFGKCMEEARGRGDSEEGEDGRSCEGDEEMMEEEEEEQKDIISEDKKKRRVRSGKRIPENVEVIVIDSDNDTICDSDHKCQVGSD